MTFALIYRQEILDSPTDRKGLAPVIGFLTAAIVCAMFTKQTGLICLILPCA